MNILAAKSETYIMSVYFSGEQLVVTLVDGREIRAPLSWFPKLKNASPEKRQKWKLIGPGIGIHWEELDEDISLEGLLKV